MGRDQDQWHADLDRITTSLDRLALDTDEEGRSAVLDRLKRPTDLFLRKRSWSFFTLTTQEDRLNALIKGHPDRAVALLACAHALSRPTIRSVLATPIELNFDLDDDACASKYLGLIASVHYINNSAVSQAEAKRAQALVLMLEKKSSSFLRHVRDFFSVADPGLLYDLFPPNTLDALLSRLFRIFAAQVEGLRYRCDWAGAHRAVSKLPSMFGIFPTLDTLLRSSLRNVRAWCLWRPVHSRIFGQEKLSVEQRTKLRDVLLLNGPDLVYARHRSALEALLSHARRHRKAFVCHGRFFAWLSTDASMDSRTFLDGVLNFPSGSRLSMAGAVDTFVFLCLRNEVSLNTLRILEEAAALKEARVYKLLSDIFYSSTSTVRTTAVTHLLTTVHASGNHTLINCLNGYIRDIIQEDLSDMQMRLHDLMQMSLFDRNPHPTALQLQALGQTITNVPSLLSTLDHQTRLLLGNWPSAVEIEGVFALRAEVVRGTVGTALETQLDQHCLIRLTGRGTLDHVSQDVIVELLWHWQERPHIPRRRLALSIVSSSTLPPSLRSQCLVLIRVMEDDHLRDLDTIISSGTEKACTHLAKVISSRRFEQYDQREFWKSVLLSMMDQWKGTLLLHTATHTDVKTWFQWLCHLREIFDISERSANGGHPMLQQELHSWSLVLQLTYLEVLLQLENDPRTALLVRSILKDWQYEESIRRVLDSFVTSSGRDPPQPLLLAIEALSSQTMRARGWTALAALAEPDYLRSTVRSSLL
ncbi:hypothetical protein A1O7_09052 [Cladophialophora yegresii CBS 114405]|uniref:Uncharacterized protein n=1 Tax=Cladophialophora yegresii CBS 114405 TaxID=1182544 RepID=W9VVA8_9EURO|nr:uncharacterized protein A1O7_09052 [Cladophialophora yegresii CBS 114405]EXJ56121.1 hypothetical protein A1O7_09052 [Cladophialophora yegresii CBS 114405]